MWRYNVSFESRLGTPILLMVVIYSSVAKAVKRNIFEIYVPQTGKMNKTDNQGMPHLLVPL
jgi:hypothetical protein